MCIVLRQFDTIHVGDTIVCGSYQTTVSEVAATRQDGKRVVNTVIFDDGTCITRQNGAWLLRAFHFPKGAD